MRRFFLLFLLLIFRNVSATHIVGGEFELIHLNEYSYRINMILYFDDVNGEPGAEDREVTAYIYGKKDNLIKASVILYNEGSTFVPYTNIACTDVRLRTRRISYTNKVFLSPEIYNDPEGYYLVWERCCRNRIITNIEYPDGTGQVFYLEFPPVIREGEPFINSSPVLFPPLSDYACIEQLYYVDFSGVDLDGDSLVYSVVHPLAGYSTPSNPVPGPHPWPYPLVNWLDGITTGNSIPGRPPLSISDDGLITLVPEVSGLFVFSVMCEEFRSGERIGVVRRDFQLLVLDCPDPGVKPEILVRLPGTEVYRANPGILYFQQNESKCLDILVRDRDGNEDIRMKVKPVNFHAGVNDLLSFQTGYIRSQTDTFKLQICFPDCPFLRDQPYIIDLIAGDDACPLPLMDTVRLTIRMEPPPNQDPYFLDPRDLIVLPLEEGDSIHLEIAGLDPDNDSLWLQILPMGFSADTTGMNFTTLLDRPGYYSESFSWKPDCRTTDFSNRTDFLMFFILEDQDYCQSVNADTLKLLVPLELPENENPVIRTDLAGEHVSLKVLEQISIQIIAEDPDGDSIVLFTNGSGFKLPAYGFTDIHSYGKGKMTRDFTWKLECQTLDPKKDSLFFIDFIAEDFDRCLLSGADTLTLKFNAFPPDNNSPEIHFLNFETPSANLLPGEEFKLFIEGYDQDLDSIYLVMNNTDELSERFGIRFDPVNGIGTVEGTVQWTGECKDLAENYGSMEIPLFFALHDNKCLVQGMDSTVFTLHLSNKEVDYSRVFIPNVFTPNHDDYNEYFTIPDLPEENCFNIFQQVAIYNRYGTQVFYSNEKDFRWSAENVIPGVYFYHVKYSSSEYRGYVQVLY